MWIIPNKIEKVCKAQATRTEKKIIISQAPRNAIGGLGNIQKPEALKTLQLARERPFAARNARGPLSTSLMAYFPVYATNLFVLYFYFYSFNFPSSFSSLRIKCHSKLATHTMPYEKPIKILRTATPPFLSSQYTHNSSASGLSTFQSLPASFSHPLFNIDSKNHVLQEASRSTYKYPISLSIIEACDRSP